MSLLPLEGDHVLEAGALWNRDGRGEVIGVAVFVGDVFDEQHEQDVVLVLAGIHAATQFIAGSPEGGVEVGFLDGHWFAWFRVIVFYCCPWGWHQLLLPLSGS